MLKRRLAHLHHFHKEGQLQEKEYAKLAELTNSAIIRLEWHHPTIANPSTDRILRSLPILSGISEEDFQVMLNSIPANHGGLI